MSLDPDDQLVQRAREGNADAVSALFRRHWRDAWRLARTVTGSEAAADDVAQEAFVRAIARLGRFRGAGTFRSWLHRIVVNEALDQRRRQPGTISAADPSAMTAAPAPEASTMGPALELLVGMPRDQRAVLVLRYCLDYSLAETSELLGVPVGTVQSRAARGLSELRNRLEVRGD